MTDGSPEGPTIDALLDPVRFPNRDSLLRYLVGICGWGRSKVASFFGLTDRQVRRLTTSAAMSAEMPEPAPSSTLTRAEIRSMVHEYARDPYTTPAEREAAWDYLSAGAPRVSA